MPTNARSSRVPITAALFVLAVGLLSGCSRPSERTALAAASPAWVGPSILEVDVECSRDVVAEVVAGAGVDDLPLITIWGRPRPGRCRVPVVLELPAGSRAVEDAATGMVLELPGPPR